MHGERHLYARDKTTNGASKEEVLTDLGHGTDRSLASYGV